MKIERQPFSRRTVLKTAGTTVVGGTTLVGTVSAQGKQNGKGNSNRTEELIDVHPENLQLESGKTGEVEVELRGPPFGRTDINVTRAPANPETFRLQGRGESQTVELGPVSEATTAEFSASTPNGNEQVVTVNIEVPDPLVAGTGADAIVEQVVEIGDAHSQAQFNALENLDLTDPFTLAVEAPELAGEDSTDYAITAYYDEFGEAPNDRLSGPSVPLSFDDNGIASVTMGSAGTDADVTTWIAPGPLSDDATLVNQIEIPEGAERFAVETAGGGGVSATADSSGGHDTGEFTDHEEV